MSAWLRNLGMFFIFGAGAMALSACPPPDWQAWQRVSAPLAGPRLTADATFTAPHTAMYFVQVKLPPAAKAELINTLIRPRTGERGKPVLCRIFEDGQLIPASGYRAIYYPAYDGPAYTVAAFTGQAGRTYDTRVQVGQAPAAFVKARPFVEVTYNSAVEARRHRHRALFFIVACWCALGLFLTFWCGSRFPLRALRPPAS